ncbi:hypothetical protein [Coxiella-like endosymbiont]|uniref:hypothetical protein n=1 Tax=Coxiella-like endosymbiont TaxID=1592897 RepID=UPI00272AF39A|nr:hypothetical protein [Coxiella-like endosymbiont]
MVQKFKAFRDGEMDFQLICQLGSANYGGTSAGGSVCDHGVNDRRSKTFGHRLKFFLTLRFEKWKTGDQRETKRYSISARDQWFKACNSFFAAEYYTPCLKPKHKELGLHSGACFIKAMKYMVSFL